MRVSRSALVLLVLAIVGAPAVPAKSSIESLVARARVRIEKGDIAGASRLAEKVRALDPDSADAYFLAGSVAKLAGELDAAFEWLSKAAEIDPPRYLAELAHDLSDLAIRRSQDSPSNEQRRSLLEDALWYSNQRIDPVSQPSEVLLEKVKILLVLDRPNDAKMLCVDRNVVSADAGALACLRELLTSVGVADRDATAISKFKPVDPAADDKLGTGVESVTLPVRWWKARPVYPELPRVARIEGRVVVQAILLRDGTVSGLEVLECDRPNLGFEESATNAVRQWRYLPAMLEGEPVDAYFTVGIDFELQ